MAASNVGAERDGGELVPRPALNADILDRLRNWAEADIGDNMTVPLAWRTLLADDLHAAIAEIVRLRSLVGAARDGQAMADIKRGLGVQSITFEQDCNVNGVDLRCGTYFVALNSGIYSVPSS